VGKAKGLEKGHRLRQVGDREVEEYLFVHVREFATTPSTNERADFGQGAVLFAERKAQRLPGAASRRSTWIGAERVSGQRGSVRESCKTEQESQTDLRDSFPSFRSSLVTLFVTLS
jgi:hypothetical protein